MADWDDDELDYISCLAVVTIMLTVWDATALRL